MVFSCGGSDDGIQAQIEMIDDGDTILTSNGNADPNADGIPDYLQA